MAAVIDSTKNASWPARLGCMAAPLIALLWLSALLGAIALLLYCWSLVRTAWLLA